MHERTVDTGSTGVSFGPHSFSDLDFADDMALLAELLKLLELLVPALETMTSEAASLGLELNWQKTKKSKLWAAGRMYHHQSLFWSGGCNG